MAPDIKDIGPLRRLSALPSLEFAVAAEESPVLPSSSFAATRAVRSAASHRSPFASSSACVASLSASIHFCLRTSLDGNNHC